MDRDYIDFKFGDNWASDFNLVVVSGGDRYTPPVFGNVNPNTTALMGKTGVHKWKTQVTEKVFNFTIAFDSVTPTQMNRIKRWLEPHQIRKLVFSEEPYKYYWAALNGEIDFSFLPFVENEIVINGKTIIEGVYKGEVTITFVCIDNYGYSEEENYEDLIAEGDNTIYPWVLTSNLLNSSSLYNNNRIYMNERNGLQLNSSQPIYLLNSGTHAADLNLSFKFIPINSPLTIRVISGYFTESGFSENSEIANITLKNFLTYPPFADVYDGNPNNWVIEINSVLKEVYIHDSNNEHVISLNRFNQNHSFLTLTECDFVDYYKPFPTSITEIEGTAIENTLFNKITIDSTTENYNLTNVRVKWAHTYL